MAFKSPRWHSLLRISTVMAIVAALITLGNHPAAASGQFENRTTADGLGSNKVHDVYVNDSAVYVATEYGVAKSTDGGTTFVNNINLPSWNTLTVSGIGHNVYVGTYGGMGVSTNDGTTYVRKGMADGFTSGRVTEVFLVGSDVYAGSVYGGFISHDNADTFTGRYFHDHDYFYPSEITSIIVDGSTVYFASGWGVHKSTDGGQSWSDVPYFGYEPWTNPMGVNVIRSFGNDLYFGTLGGLFVSHDAGATFSQKQISSGLGSNNVLGIDQVDGKLFVGTSAGFSVSTDGGATFTNLTTADGLANNYVNSVTASGGKVYVGTNGGMSIYTIPAASPVITSFPVSVSSAVAGSASFSVTATSPDGGTLSYQWQKDLVDISGATGHTLTLSNIAASMGGSYRVVVTNSYGVSTTSAASSSATLSILATAPAIASFPLSTSGNVGGTASLGVTALTGDGGTLSYQWQKDQVDISGATGPTLSFTNLSESDAGNYRVVVTNTVGQSTAVSTSAAAALVVNVPSTSTSTSTTSTTVAVNNSTSTSTSTTSTTVAVNNSTSTSLPVETIITTTSSTSTTLTPVVVSMLKSSAGTRVVISRKPSTQFAAAIEMAVTGNRVIVALKSPAAAKVASATVVFYSVSMIPGTSKARKVTRIAAIKPASKLLLVLVGTSKSTYRIVIVARQKSGKSTSWTGPKVSL